MLFVIMINTIIIKISMIIIIIKISTIIKIISRIKMTRASWECVEQLPMAGINMMMIIKMSMIMTRAS